ncbi:MAG: sigma factor regulator FecR [Deltaproteobacteria bacterium RBG_13_65_10]|nr:MAG: sigma factor regulator FecR [Deltaproteobacteria bacterium RBG_13_65_10]
MTREGSDSMNLEEAINRAAELLAEATRVVVFTGAGISTESGIPDFRSPGGVWDRFDPMEFTYQKFVSSEESRRKYWALSKLFYEPLVAAQPNPAHHACVAIERWGRLDCVVTQNIDGLHQRAGLSGERVIEIHGTALTVSCLSCRHQLSREVVQARVAAGEEVPRCEQCGGLLKPDTVSFGQAMPERETAEAFRRAESCDLCWVIGSSLAVTPAAHIPAAAMNAGARLLILNGSETPLDALADVVLRGKAGDLAPRIVERAKTLVGGSG